MATQKTIMVYGNFYTPEEEKERDIIREKALVRYRQAMNKVKDIDKKKSPYLHMKELIKAEKINPDRYPDYEGEQLVEWLKKIALLDISVEERKNLISLYEK